MKSEPKFVQDAVDAFFEDEKTNNFINKLRGTRTHTEQHEVYVNSDINDLNTILTIKKYEAGVKSVQSSFNNDNWKNDYLPRMFMDKDFYSQIEKWLSISDDGDKIPFSYTFTEDKNDEPIDSIGSGFERSRNGKIRRYKTNTLTAVFVHDDKEPYGFYMLTAYPDLAKTPNREKIECDLFPILEQTDKYKKASPLEQAYFKTSCDTKTNMDYVHFMEKGGEKFILHTVPTQTKTGTPAEYSVCIYPNRTTIRAQTIADKKPLDNKIKKYATDTLHMTIGSHGVISLTDKVMDYLHNSDSKKYQTIYSRTKRIQDYMNPNGDDDRKNKRIQKAMDKCPSSKSDAERSDQYE